MHTSGKHTTRALHGRPSRRPHSLGASSLRQLIQRRLRSVGYGDAGFTLVEVLVALVIFAIVAGAATTALLTGIKGNNDTNDRIAATQLAQQANDRARAMTPIQLAASPSATFSPSVGSKTYAVTRRVSYLPSNVPCPATPSPSDTVAHEIQVQIVVAVPGSSQTVQMSSRLAC